MVMLAACVQMCSGTDVHANLTTAAKLLNDAARLGAGLAVLPENFAFMSGSEQDKRAVAEDGDNSRILAFLSGQAKRHGMYIVGGTLALKTDVQPGLRNASPFFSPAGDCLATYDKMHLFDVDLPGESYRESEVVAAGAAPVMADCGPFRLGMSVCYDLRFPELYRHYSQHGCHLLSVPAAFTVPTGRAHWEILLRARAIENQCYVLAAAQSGSHPGGRKTWGHSMLVDPWGEVLDECLEEEGLAMANVSMKRIEGIRAMLPALTHRRL